MVPRILWGALLASQVIYVVMLSVPGLLERGAGGVPDPTFLPPLAIAAGGVAIASFVAPMIFRRSALARASVETREIPDPEALQGFRRAATMREYVDPSAARKHAAALAFVPFVLSLALSEAISIFGFLAGFTGSPVEHWAPFFAAGMTLTAIRFPTERSFFGPFEAKTGIALPR